MAFKRTSIVAPLIFAILAAACASERNEIDVGQLLPDADSEQQDASADSGVDLDGALDSDIDGESEPDQDSAPACDDDYSICGEACVSLDTDPRHCGACGNVCAPNEYCSSGLCCGPGLAACEGVCIRMSADPDNCGACGNACSGDMPVCYAGTCIPKQKVVVIMGILPSYQENRGQDVRDKLMATGAFSVVDGLDAKVDTPTLEQLLPYDAALVYSDDIGPCTSCGGIRDPNALGDILADYFDQGGRVVIASEAHTAKSGVGGRFARSYLLIAAGYFLNMNPDSLGPVNEPLSPLMDGVENLSVEGAFANTGTAMNGGTIVAGWASGLPLVVRGVIKERNRVDLNFYPVSSDAMPISWKGDGAMLLRNALLFQ